MNHRTIRALLALMLATSLHARITIDKIVVRVNGDNVLQSDLRQPRIEKEGMPYTEQEAIHSRLLIQRAVEMKMLPSTMDVERYVASFKIQNNLTGLTDQEFEEQLKQSGFTLKMYKEQIGCMIAMENVKRAEVSEKIVVTSQEVEDEFNKKPRYTKESYHLKVATIPADKLEQKDEMLKKGQISWEDLGWVAKKGLDAKFAGVFSMTKGQVSQPIQDGEEYQLVMLVDKQGRRKKTLDECYGQIERLLQKGKRKNFVGEFEKELEEKASVIRLN